MKRKIIFSLLWAVVFAVITFLSEMLIGAILGFAGIASWKESTVVFIGRTLSFLFFVMPVVGLVLGLVDLLPGTRHRTAET
jgi:uncharacterized membrane protein YtjA (UPF0391 family)